MCTPLQQIGSAKREREIRAQQLLPGELPCEMCEQHRMRREASVKWRTLEIVRSDDTLNAILCVFIVFLRKWQITRNLYGPFGFLIDSVYFWTSVFPIRPHSFPPRTTEALDPQAVAGTCLSDFFFLTCFAVTRDPRTAVLRTDAPLSLIE